MAPPLPAPLLKNVKFLNYRWTGKGGEHQLIFLDVSNKNVDKFHEWVNDLFVAKSALYPVYTSKEV